MLCNINERSSRDGRQDGIRLRYNECAVAVCEDEVSAACLLDLCACCRIEIDILGKAFLVSSNDRMQRHSIVKSCLDVTCSARSCTVKIRDLNSDRLSTALEVRAYRRSEDPVLIIISRLNADNGVDTEDIRSQIERCACSERRNPCSIACNSLLD